MSLPPGHPTSIAFLDESGSIASDRFFAVGCLKVPDPSTVLRSIQRLRDRKHWYDEIHFADLTRDTLPSYRDVVDVLAGSANVFFSCFVADRSISDPIARFGSSAKAYEKMAEQLLIGSIAPNEIVTVIADEYSTPDVNPFEVVVKAEVNRRLKCLAIASVVLVNSKAAVPLQLVDLMTSAVAFEFRQHAGLASGHSPKAQLAEYVRQKFKVTTFLRGVRTERVNVALSRPNGQRGLRFK